MLDIHCEFTTREHKFERGVCTQKSELIHFKDLTQIWFIMTNSIDNI